MRIPKGQGAWYPLLFVVPLSGYPAHLYIIGLSGLEGECEGGVAKPGAKSEFGLTQSTL